MIPFLNHIDMKTNRIANLADPVDPQDSVTKSHMDGLLAGKSDVGHLHDDRYYTEAEIDALLGGKSDTGHTHVEADITDLGNYALVGHGHAHTDITDFDAGVQANRLDQMAAPTAAVAFGAQKITGLLDPTDPQDAATKAYADAGGAAFVGARIQAATSTTVPDTAATEIILDSNIFESGVTVNTASNRLEIVTSGIYHLESAVRWSPSSAGYRDHRILVNGVISDQTSTTGTNGGFGYTRVSTILVLMAGDLLTLQGYQTSGGSRTVTAGVDVFLAAHRIGDIP